MNKGEFIERIAERSKLTKKDTDKFLIAFMDIVKEVLEEGEKISLVTFGTFQVTTRKATIGINPKTGKKINIPEKRVAKLKFSDSVNERLNKK